ncbi:unnamed protein product [Rhizoctonia solani]|uniref:BTB domain-containing protein n=1 Tax=Rhizoctonia solani TaxID=456999 RepID=A0A8H3D2S4_9AGAM|nr:unnamed protein product [Rhizoctonia solani]
MSKRPSDAGIPSSQRLSQPAPFKRAKKEQTPEPEVTIIDDGLSSISDSSSEPEELAPPVRNPEFYFEDGSIIFRVGDVLFKVHASLLKIESGDFEKAFDVPPKIAEATKPRGACDENPIIIPDAKASQFSDLMGVIYRPRHLDLFACDATIWDQFVFYLNVAMLAYLFAMTRIEEWARSKLAELVQTSGQKLSMEAYVAAKVNELMQDYVAAKVNELMQEDGDNVFAKEDSDKVNGGTNKDDATPGDRNPSNGEPSTGAMRADISNDFSNPNNPNNPTNPRNPNPSPNPNNTRNTTQSNDTNDMNNLDQTDSPKRANTIDNVSNSGGKCDDNKADEDEDGDDGSGDDEEMADGDSEDETALPPEEVVCPSFQLMDALLYAEAVSDSPLHHGVRNVFQHFCTHPKHALPHALVKLFKVPDLQEKDPSMFGFLFLMLLNQGNQVWKQDIFTRMDRMAFFSAQSYLTPFPDSLKTFVVVPLFTMPISAKSFATIFSDATTDKSCIEECFTRAFTYWNKVFDEAYYADMGSKETLTPIKALISLPHRRLNLAGKLVLRSKCKHKCHLMLLSQVDRDVQGLYARLAEYYQGIE